MPSDGPKSGPPGGSHTRLAGCVGGGGRSALGGMSREVGLWEVAAAAGRRPTKIGFWFGCGQPRPNHGKIRLSKLKFGWAAAGCGPTKLFQVITKNISMTLFEGTGGLGLRFSWGSFWWGHSHSHPPPLGTPVSDLASHPSRLPPPGSVTGCGLCWGHLAEGNQLGGGAFQTQPRQGWDGG